MQAYHDTLAKVCFGNDNGAHILQHLHEHCILTSGFERSSNVSQSRVNVLDVELIFECDGDAMERALELLRAAEFDIQCFGLF